MEHPHVPDTDRWRVGEASVDALTREILMPGARHAVRVTPKALGVLRVLARQPGHVVTRQALLDEVWPETLPTDDVLTQAVTHLRKAFSSGSAGEPAGRAYIETIAKSGYRLKQTVAPADASLAPPALDPAERADPAAAAATATATATADGVPLADAAGTVPASPGSIVPSAPVHSATQPDISASSAAVSHPPVTVAAAAGAPVSEPPGPDVPAPTDAAAVARTIRSPAVPARRRMRWAIPLSAAAVLLSSLVALFALLVRPSWPSGAQAAVPPYRLITSGPGLKGSPALSPDGRQVAYAIGEGAGEDTHIVVQPAHNAPARGIVAAAAPGTRDSDPSWSPDGRDIAFVRREGPDACAILVVAVDSPRSVREAMRCDGEGRVGFDWMPDGGSLVIGTLDAAHGGTGMKVLDLASGALRPLPSGAVQGDIEQAPRVSPDGRWILFARDPQLGDLWRVPVAGGAAERLTHLGGELRGWSWAGADAVVFGRRVEAEVRLYRLDLVTGDVTDLGLDDAQAPAVAQDALVFVRRRPQFGLYRIPADGHDGDASPQRVFASTGRDNMPVVSPDGTRLAFGSDRAGPYELWLTALAPAATPAPVEGFALDGTHPPTWSSDGTRVVAVGTVRSDDGAAGEAALFEVDVRSRQAVRLELPVRRIVQGGYAADGGLLVVARGRGDGLDLIRFERAAAGWRRTGALADVSQFRQAADGAGLLLTRLSENGLWRVGLDLDPASLRQVDATRPMRQGYRSWALAPGGAVDYLAFDAAGCGYRIERMPAGAPPTAAPPVCLGRDRQVAENGFSIDPVTGAAYVAMTVDDGAEIGLVRISSVPGPENDVMRVVKRLIGKGKLSS